MSNKTILFNNLKNFKFIDQLYRKLTLLNYIKIFKHLKLNNLNNYIIKKNLYNFKNFYKSSNYININYKELKNINKKLKSGIFLLSTSLGIITHKKAILLKIGGILLCYIN
uniref:Ribosomal protein S8 n=1 Tax=Babesia duncani TaxID=323732 RepID=A0A385GNI7_9APIC|nr:ribosomal protein S8 [Babesia duncani]